MGLTPDVFWNMTLSEWRAALRGFAERRGLRLSAPMPRTALDALMQRFPD